MEILLNEKELKEVLHSALCNGLGWISGYGFYGCINSTLKTEYSYFHKTVNNTITAGTPEVIHQVCFRSMINKH